MAKFWYTEPLVSLGQRKGSLPFGLYPATVYHSSSDPTSLDKPYSSKLMGDMLDWCDRNLKDSVSWSNRYGSFHFRTERDRAMFRLFHSDDTMPEPTHDDTMPEPGRPPSRW